MPSTPTAKITLAATKPAAAVTDALIVALVPGRGRGIEVISPGLTVAVRTRLVEAFTAVGAGTGSGDITKVPGGGSIKATTVVGLGLGDEGKRADAEAMRRAIGGAIRGLAGTRRVTLALPVEDEDALLTIALSALLGSYDFVRFRSRSVAGRSVPVRAITILLDDAPTPAQKKAVKDVTAVAAAVNLARDLVNTPPSSQTPAVLAEAARDAMTGLPVDVTVWDEAALMRDGCGGIIAVGMGSANPPRLIKMRYAPDDATMHLALVGKGVTFDSGGISIKPAAGMEDMKGDMAGAAAVIAAVKAIATLGLPIHVTGWVPSAENMPGGNAQRPSDVITVFDGTTVEVINTDAEGRLILADALGMAVTESPDLIIDVATLTGAQRIALGPRIAGIMSNTDSAREQVCLAADRAGESVWPMPLPADLRAGLDSATADIANSSDRLGGMLSAGIFLSEFVPADQPWVHMDIAGPAFNEKSPYGYTPKGGTGAAVRTFVQVAAEMAQGAM